MAGGKLSPRQKMINMMYLVLTALLALNVTKEVINAFVTINESVVLSKQNLEKKNQETYASFAQAMSVDAKKYNEANTKAQAVKKAADDLNQYIDAMKVTLVRESDRLSAKDSTPKLPEMDNKEDYDTPTRLMIGKDDHKGKGAKADSLRQKLDAFKKLIVTNAPANSKIDYKKQLDILINTSDPKSPVDGKSTWELVSFYHNPVVATVALLSKFQSDIRSAESQVTDELLNSVGKYDFHPDVLQPAIIPNSTVVTNGSNYEAKVFLAATSSTIAPEVFLNAHVDPATKTCVGCEGQPLPVDPNGYSQFTQTSTGEGERKWNGVIRVKKGDGTMDYYPFESSYIAQKPTSVVAAEKMNVLYIGVDNPVAISVPGVSNDKVRVSISGAGGTLRPNNAAGAGHYIANVSNVGKATINVTAEIGGKVTPMGAFEYRVKQVPTPVATVSNKFRTGPIDRNILKAGVVIPILDDFDFELFFVTTGFKMVIISKGNLLEYETAGARLSQPMMDALAKAKPGDKVFFENIKARMDKSNDTKTRNLSPMTFTIQ
jgi:gliding motility-associated protein GldM